MIAAGLLTLLIVNVFEGKILTEGRINVVEPVLAETLICILHFNVKRRSFDSNHPAALEM